MKFVNQIVHLVFLGIMAVSMIAFPVLFLIQGQKHHDEEMDLIKSLKKEDK